MTRLRAKVCFSTIAAFVIALGLCSCAAGEIRPDDDDDDGPDSDTDTDTDTDSDTGTDTDSDTGTDTDSDTDTDTDSDTDTDTDSDTDTDTDTGGGDVCPHHCVSTSFCTGISGSVHDEYVCDFPPDGVCCEW